MSHEETETVRVLLVIGDQAEIVPAPQPEPPFPPERYPAAEIVRQVGAGGPKALPGMLLLARRGKDGRFCAFSRAPQA